MITPIKMINLLHLKLISLCPKTGGTKKEDQQRISSNKN